MRSAWKHKDYDFLAVTEEGRLKNPRLYFSPLLMDKRVSAYSGKKTESFIVRPYMADQKIGYFIPTRYSGKMIHIKKKKRKHKKT